MVGISLALYVYTPSQMIYQSAELYSLYIPLEYHSTGSISLESGWLIQVIKLGVLI
ncbi:hypothetical protein [Tenacibaculum sp. C7A-26P2]|uniref:hypothetical protein n=1 Tax=Tenacibaculum sp. C7A-26P2 TaxID=3447504 RepID=UPI003F859623